jgi:exodeoxyribonuclease V gamma subunit
LQPFDARNLTAGALGTPGPFSFDPAALAGARAAARAAHPPQPFLPAVLPPIVRRDIELADLTALLTHPARGFLRQRLDVAVRFEQDDPSDSLTVELDALERWKLGDRVLRDRLAGVDEPTCRNVEWRRGMLPPGPLGGRQLAAVLAEVEPLVRATAELRAPARRTVDVLVQLAGGRQLRGSLPGMHDRRLVTVSYSKLSARDRLRAWIALVALTVSHPETPWTAVTVGRGEPGHPRRSVLGPLDVEHARTTLDLLVDLYDRGLCEPLPLPTKTSAAYAAARWNHDDVDEAVRRARRSWASGDFPGEDADVANELVWGRRADLDVLLAALPGDDNQPGQRELSEPSRFAALAVRLWSPLLDAERIETS